MIDWRTLPSLAALRAFASYAETGSVARAGAQLNVSHAAISQQLRKLEDDLGVALLNRDGAKMTLTIEGAALARALSEGFGQISETVRDLTQTDAQRPLQISVTPTFASAWLMPRLAEFRTLHPEIALRIDPSVEVQRFAPGGIDLALRYGAGPWPGLDNELLFPSSIVVTAAPDLIKGVDVSDDLALCALPWLAENGVTEASLFSDLFPGLCMNLDSALMLPGHFMLDAARQGQGLAMQARINVEPDIQAGRLIVLREEAVGRGYHLVTRPGVMRPPARAFIRWLRKAAG